MILSPTGGEGRAGGAGLAGEFVEEGVFAVVCGPDSHIETPGDPALGGLPKQLGVAVFGEFVETDIATVNGHGLGCEEKARMTEPLSNLM